MDRALLARLEKTTWVHRHPRGGPLLLFLLTAMATLLAVAALERADTVRRRTELETYASEVAARVERRALEQISILHAASTVFALHNRLSRQDFTAFCNGLRSSGAFHGPLQMGWVERVEANDIPAFERARRADGLTNFKVFPEIAADRRVAFPIVYVDPWKTTYRGYIGYDLYADPALRSAMARAAERGEPVATRALQIVERKRTSITSGVLIFMPVYGRMKSGRTLKGFTYSTIQASDLMNPISNALHAQDKQIMLFDGQKDPDNLLVQHSINRRSGQTVERELSIANRKWILTVSATDGAPLSDLALATLLFGLVLSCLVSFIARLITRRAAEDRELLDWYTRQSAIRTSLSRELSHRVKNTLANVLSIVALTRRRSSNIDDFADSLTGRLRALSATHDLLSLADWREASIGEVVRAELAPYMEEDDARVALSGPEVSLAPNDALSLGLAIHELTTNAAKYGALSDDGGRVVLSWRLETPDVAVVDWRELDGPRVEPPTRRGFGMELIEKIVSQELHSKVELQFEPSGVKCRLRVPVRKRTDFEIRAPQ